MVFTPVSLKDYLLPCVWLFIPGGRGAGEQYNQSPPFQGEPALWCERSVSDVGASAIASGFPTWGTTALRGFFPL